MFDTPSALCYQNYSMPADKQAQARQRFQEANQAQMEGDYDRAVELYRGSLALHPTAEAHTFLGWTFHFQGKTQEAIAECKLAIEIDPEFGNPYNDIGAYLIGLERFDEAIPWLEQAIAAKRYEARHYPYFNLGRVYLAKSLLNRAREQFQHALEIEPRYALARQALEKLRRMVN
jgi:Tfp pilus assembly protein PilF